jgi:hypothetical protein
MLQAPDSFEGSVNDLYLTFTSKILPDPNVVAHIHVRLKEYCANPNAVFLIRYVSSTVRRQIYHTKFGDRFKATDNSPAWWMSGRLMDSWKPSADEFAVALARAPSHMFDIKNASDRALNRFGWHIAHFYNVKDRQTEYQLWNRQELARRFLRNIHPCNQFYLPLNDWAQYGERIPVKSFFAHIYANRYGEVWKEYLQLIAEKPISFDSTVTSFRYVINSKRPESETKNIRQPRRIRLQTEHIAESNTTSQEIDWGRLRSQRDMMRQLYKKYMGRSQDMIAAYADAEQRGLVHRKSNVNNVSPEDYAYRLYLDGMKKGWF